MKKRDLVIRTSFLGLVAIVVVTVFVVARGGGFGSHKPVSVTTLDSSANASNNSGNKGSPVGGPGQPIDTSKAGAYVAYRDAIISSTEGQKILYFSSSSCAQCQQLEQSIATGPIPAHVTIIKVDYDANAPLRGKYGVTAQATFVLVDDQGNLVKKYVANDAPTLQAVLQNLL